MLSTRLVLCFFFFRQKTEYEMRISDWISDFCSSDLEWTPDDASPKITSPACTRLPVSASSRSTAPTVKPARSYSPSGYMPGISAVSPPIKAQPAIRQRSEEHTSELQSLMRISYAVFCLKKKTYPHNKKKNTA